MSGGTLVRERLDACVNVVPGVSSLYRWKGKVEEEREVLLVIKSRARCISPGGSSAWPLASSA